MASSQEYLDFIIGQLDTLEDVSFRKMMGEYILYFRGKIFGGIYDDRLLVKITKASRQLILEAVEELPYDGAKPMLLVDDVDNKEFLYQLITEMYEELPIPKAKKKKIC
ncbi:TfoX/Sxy family protein [Clostridium sp. AWRP]|uniref:TfoX/Sxy family protein n=1 Tax=Clostridium sp. AWRP TaxID=2212991 RepID=UPI000FDB5A32|nr:TfoX/Sxy family protein [Clostridium sp. AWRP]AZV57390.1 TfoX/Sxy family protein [Clostridium sp. AWRP]